MVKIKAIFYNKLLYKTPNKIVNYQLNKIVN